MVDHGVAVARLAPEMIRRKAHEILVRPEFKHSDAGIAPTWLSTLWRAIRRFLGKVVHQMDAIHFASPVLYWFIMAGLAAVLLFLIFHITWSVYQSLRRWPGRLTLLDIAEDNPTSPSVWESKAKEAWMRGDLVGAVRFLFSASLLQLELASGRVFRKCATNREHLASVAGTPAHAPLSVLAEIVETRWYGGRDCLSEDYDQCAAAYTELMQAAQEIRRVRQV